MSDVSIDNEARKDENAAKAASISTNSTFKNGWQEAGFVLAIMLGQCFNLTPLGAVSSSNSPTIDEPDFIQALNARWLIAEDLSVAGNNGQMSLIVAGFSMTTVVSCSLVVGSATSMDIESFGCWRWRGL